MRRVSIRNCLEQGGLWRVCGGYLTMLIDQRGLSPQEVAAVFGLGVLASTRVKKANQALEQLCFSPLSSWGWIRLKASSSCSQLSYNDEIFSPACQHKQNLSLRNCFQWDVLSTETENDTRTLPWGLLNLWIKQGLPQIIPKNPTRVGDCLCRYSRKYTCIHIPRKRTENFQSFKEAMVTKQTNKKPVSYCQ